MRKSRTYIDKTIVDGVQQIVRNDLPLTKGQALVRVRAIWGGEARAVFQHGTCCILDPEGTLVASGPTWEAALGPQREAA